MSAISANSPIQRLDFDTFWCIVQINADMFDDPRALETTLATSRVCRDWRNFMLSTTSIWAHLFDLNHGLWATAEGRTELTRRSGTALLWMIFPCIYLYRTADIIRNIISKNWERTQKLQIVIGNEHVNQLSPFYFPAPHLESLDIRDNSHISSKVFSSIFGGNAPMLRDLRLSGYTSKLTTTPFLRQLHSLDLGANTGLTVSEMLSVLTLTTNLVDLRLGQILVDRTTSTLSLASLPKLAQLNLHLTAAITPGAALLDHVCIPPTCSLTLSVHSIHHREMDDESTFAAIIRTISTCAWPSFTHHAPQKLSLTITPRHFTLETTPRSNGPTFRFCMAIKECPPQHVLRPFPKHVLPVLLSEFSLPSFSKVSSFHFKISGVNRQAPEIATFIACLPSVNIIKADKWSLRHLIRAEAALKRADTGPTIAFPTLKILDVRSLLSFYLGKSFDSSPDPVSKFVVARIAHSHPISIIDFTENPLNVLPDLEFLRKAVGLKVRWRQLGVSKIHEYVVGSGAPPKPMSGSTS